ncbi:MAG: riboflavin biosynthesis protein RibD, partial [Phenylobacterium sp.]
EELALAAAGAAARGATALVTLEPCARRSVEGVSCTDRLIAAGVRRVVIACDDASVFAGGEGEARLRAAGVDVEAGLLEAEARPLYARYRPVSGH